MRPLVGWALVVVLGHAFWLARPFVNQEQAFWCAARAFLEPAFGEGFARYFRDQSNPLGYSAIAALSTRALGLPLSAWSVRLPTLAGGVLLLVGGWILARELHPDEPWLFSLWAGVVVLNPLVWVYGGEATADLLPAGLATLGLGLAVQGRRAPRQHAVAAAVLAVAALVKLNVVLLGPGLAYAVVSREGRARSRLLPLAWYVMLPGAALLLYFGWVRTRFGLLLLTERAWHVHGPDVLGAPWLAALAAYASYVALLLGPLALLGLWRATRWPSGSARWLVTGLACAAPAAALVWGQAAGGEMGYGSLDRMLPGGAGATGRAVGVAVAVVLLADTVRRAVAHRSWLARLTLATLVPYLALSSLSRPAQRYLLLVLPLVLLDAVMAEPDRRLALRAAGASSMALFGALSLAASLAIAANARATDAMTGWIEGRGWTAQTDPGALRGHTDHRFPLEPPPDPRYVVVQGNPHAVLHQEEVVVLGRTLRRYSLVEAAPR
jgi:hypothetical protein